MWLFQNDSFISVVAHRDKPGHLLVRSRIEGDIERAIPTAEVYQDASTDYRYRAVITQEALKEALIAAVNEIDYGNFKGSVKDLRRHDAYMRVWSVMAQVYGAYGDSA